LGKREREVKKNVVQKGTVTAWIKSSVFGGQIPGEEQARIARRLLDGDKKRKGFIRPRGVNCMKALWEKGERRVV